MTYAMKIEEIEPNIFIVYMRNTDVLGTTFMRFQEHYESPYSDIKGKIFTREYFKKIYMERRQADKFTYLQDWAGYNLPSYVLKPFISGKFNPLLECEQQLVDYFKDKKGKFYVIGAAHSDRATIKHEVSHGLWYTNNAYKLAQQKVIKTLSKKARATINKYLLGYGYCEDVLEDETCSFLLTNSTWFIEDCDISKKVVDRVTDQIKENFKKFTTYGGLFLPCSFFKNN
jgi:hypothetical protein